MLAQPLAYAPFPAVGFLVFTVVWLVATAFWLWMIVDCMRSGRVADREKFAWLAMLLTMYVLGAVLYLVIVRIRRPLPPKG